MKTVCAFAIFFIETGVVSQEARTKSFKIDCSSFGDSL